MFFTANRGRVAAIRAARAAAMLGCLYGFTIQAQQLDTAQQQKIRAATFEVVMLKPVDDPVVYEKPLPLELLTYQFRTDKYFSVGTAFAIGDHRFVTAAHVLGLGVETQWGSPALRDGNGNIYPVAKVLKYSTNQDFAVFSVSDEPAVQPYEIGSRPALNETVYAVGNALGEGVVIRDGAYTSDTPEERDGKWKWLRFSAAASPGNSGGPLLDKDGKVIGVVLRKSPSENLNYALSMDDLLAAKNDTAVIDTRATYQLDVFDYKQTESLHKEFGLPRGYADFAKSDSDIWNSFNEQMLQDLLSSNAERVFPRGEGSTELLHTIQVGDVPGLIAKSQDGSWSAQRAVQGGRSDLGHNGYVSVGHAGTVGMMKLRRPDDVPASRYYSDSKLFMDMLLKAVPMSRAVGPENIRMISLGKAHEDTVFTDAWRRKWQLRQWWLPYQDAVVLTMALPVPQGYVVLTRSMRTAQRNEHINDFKALTGFVATGYGGTLAQWQDFLKQSDLLPAVFGTIGLQADYGKSLRYSSPRLSLALTPATQKITPNSVLSLDFSYFDDHGKVVWDVARLKLNEDANNQTFISIARNLEPAASMGDEFKSRWSKLVHHQHPYDGVLTNDGDFSSIHAVRQPLAKAGAGDSGVLYSVMLQNDGIETQDAMKTRLDQLMQSLDAKDDVAPLGGGGEAQD
jgi:serine protease Do